MQKALEQMNVKLAEVVSDITGVTGMAIIQAILARRARPAGAGRAAQRASASGREAEIARALEGTWRAEHLFALKQAVELYEFYRRQLQECDGELQAYLGTFEEPDPYRLLRHGEVYVRRDVEAYEAAYRSRVVKSLVRRAGELGYRLEPMVAAGVSWETAIATHRAPGRE